MKKVAYYNSRMQAEIVAQSLRAHGIEAEVVGSKDYATFVVGGDLGSYFIHVDEEKFEEAQKLVTQTNVTPVSEVSITEPRVYLKKAIVYAVFAMVSIPIIFNYVSITNLLAYQKAESDNSKKQFWSLIVFILQLPAIAVLYYIISHKFFGT